MTRILHVIGSLDMGGSQMFVLNLYNHIDRNKIQFDFVVREGEKYFLEDKVRELGGKIYRLPALRLTNYLTYVSAWKKFFKEHPEYKVIHGHVRSTAAIYLRIAKSFGCKTISHSHNTHNTQGLSAIVKAILQFPIRFIADYFFACSQAAGEWLFGDQIVKQNNFFVVPNAIDTQKFAYNPMARKKTRQELNLTNNLVVGHVGRLNVQKNHSFLLEIFAEIYKQNSTARLLLVGDGPLKQDLIKRAKQLHIDSAVLFCGNQAAEHYYHAMDVFVFPSIYEGLGIVLIEAQTSGLPCVISANLPKEADLDCGLITRVSLEQPSDVWSRIVLSQMGKKPRQSQQAQVTSKGYDISTTTQWLQDFYLEKYDK